MHAKCLATAISVALTFFLSLTNSPPPQPPTPNHLNHLFPTLHRPDPLTSFLRPPQLKILASKGQNIKKKTRKCTGWIGKIRDWNRDSSDAVMV
ncbi:hypothetical protein Pfo_010645 [Paulownia fortunei]|nr:hypothetical protein Pfo_010645 [Paulownia fortunei]